MDSFRENRLRLGKMKEEPLGTRVSRPEPVPERPSIFAKVEGLAVSVGLSADQTPATRQGTLR